MKNTIYYVIGDIHGEIDKLRMLHARLRNMHVQKFSERAYILVHLGDYIDRGAGSCEVVNLLMKMDADPNENVINLKGNHEQMMIDAFKEKDQYVPGVWESHGGKETMKSYSRNGFDTPPQEHLDWMAGLPSFFWDKEAKIIFVHAGIDPKHFPNDGEDTHLWTRSRDFFDTRKWKNFALEGVTVIHGHTPTKSGRPDIDGDFLRVNIDTGACYGGLLTAAVLSSGIKPTFIGV